MNNIEKIIIDDLKKSMDVVFKMNCLSPEEKRVELMNFDGCGIHACFQKIQDILGISSGDVFPATMLQLDNVLDDLLSHPNDGEKFNIVVDDIYQCAYDQSLEHLQIHEKPAKETGLNKLEQKKDKVVFSKKEASIHSKGEVK